MSRETRFDLRVDSVSVTPVNAYAVDIEFTAITEDVLDHFDVDYIVEHFGIESLLKSIGEDEAKSFFEWKE